MKNDSDEFNKTQDDLKNWSDKKSFSGKKCSHRYSDKETDTSLTVSYSVDKLKNLPMQKCNCSFIRPIKLFNPYSESSLYWEINNEGVVGSLNNSTILRVRQKKVETPNTTKKSYKDTERQEEETFAKLCPHHYYDVDLKYDFLLYNPLDSYQYEDTLKYFPDDI